MEHDKRKNRRANGPMGVNALKRCMNEIVDMTPTDVAENYGVSSEYCSTIIDAAKRHVTYVEQRAQREELQRIEEETILQIEQLQL